MLGRSERGAGVGRAVGAGARHLDAPVHRLRATREGEVDVGRLDDQPVEIEGDQPRVEVCLWLADRARDLPLAGHLTVDLERADRERALRRPVDVEGQALVDAHQPARRAGRLVAGQHAPGEVEALRVLRARQRDAGADPQQAVELDDPRLEALAPRLHRDRPNRRALGRRRLEPGLGRAVGTLQHALEAGRGGGSLEAQPAEEVLRACGVDLGVLADDVKLPEQEPAILQETEVDVRGRPRPQQRRQHALAPRALALHVGADAPLAVGPDDRDGPAEFRDSQADLVQVLGDGLRLDLEATDRAGENARRAGGADDGGVEPGPQALGDDLEPQSGGRQLAEIHRADRVRLRQLAREPQVRPVEFPLARHLQHRVRPRPEPRDVGRQVGGGRQQRMRLDVAAAGGGPAAVGVEGAQGPGAAVDVEAAALVVAHPVGLHRERLIGLEAKPAGQPAARRLQRVELERQAMRVGHAQVCVEMVARVQAAPGGDAGVRPAAAAEIEGSGDVPVPLRHRQRPARAQPTLQRVDKHPHRRRLGRRGRPLLQHGRARDEEVAYRQRVGVHPARQELGRPPRHRQVAAVQPHPLPVRDGQTLEAEGVEEVPLQPLHVQPPDRPEPQALHRAHHRGPTRVRTHADPDDHRRDQQERQYGRNRDRHPPHHARTARPRRCGGRRRV